MRLLIFLLVLMPITLKSQDFRKMIWGESITSVKSKETWPLTLSTNENLVYSGKLNDLECSLVYKFNLKKQVYAAGYMFENRHFEILDHLADYNKLKALLIEKYKSPTVDTVKWSNSQYKDDPNHLSNALNLGHVSYYALWMLPKFAVQLSLDGGDFEAKVRLVYISNTIAPTSPEERKKLVLRDL